MAAGVMAVVAAVAMTAAVAVAARQFPAVSATAKKRKKEDECETFGCAFKKNRNKYLNEGGPRIFEWKGKNITSAGRRNNVENDRQEM